MIARLGAKALLLALGLGMVFFGIGLLGHALAIALVGLLGQAAAYAVAGGVLLLPPLFWMAVRLVFRPKPKSPPPGVWMAVIAALAKEAPWVAMLGAGLTGVAEMILNRNKSKK